MALLLDAMSMIAISVGVQLKYNLAYKPSHVFVCFTIQHYTLSVGSWVVNYNQVILESICGI